MIRLVVFDLWDTLAYKEVNYSSTEKVLEAVKADIPKSKFSKIFEKATQTRPWRSKANAYANLCRAISVPVKKETVCMIQKIRDKAEAKTKLYAHTISMLKQLRAKKIKIGIISNTSIFAVKQIKNKTNLLKYIDYPLFSYSVGLIKPDLKIFRKMLSRSGFKPKESIMVGDKENDDVIPAKKLGMHAILFRDYKKLKKDFVGFNIILK